MKKGMNFGLKGGAWSGRLMGALLLTGICVAPGWSAELNFERQKISDAKFEAASACDVNKDGKLDIVSGEFWYEGPDFKKKHKCATIKETSEYLDDFCDYPMDVNGDGYTDIVTGAWFGQPMRWLENPKGEEKEWPVHEIAQVGPIETIRFWDVDGDGTVEVCPNAGGNVVFFKLDRDANGKGTGKFTRYVVKEGGCGHGLGYGDVNGDGRGDFIVPEGWFEGPKEPLKGPWTFHADFNLGSASVPTLVYDVNEDGKADLIVGQAHDYGLDWWEQGAGADGKPSWTKHRVDSDVSEYHDMQLVDINKDKKLELVTGKRFRAHNDNDPGAADPVITCYYTIDKGQFERHVIDFGPAAEHSGVGIYFWIADLDGNGWDDIVAPGKEGLYLFRNMGKK